MNDNNNASKWAGFGSFMAKQMLPIVVVALAILGALWVAIQYFGPSGQHLSGSPHGLVSQAAQDHGESAASTTQAAEDRQAAIDVHADIASHQGHTASAELAVHQAVETDSQADAKSHTSEGSGKVAHPVAGDQAHASANRAGTSHDQGMAAAAVGQVHAPADEAGTGHDQGMAAAAGHGAEPEKSYPAVGMAFVDAVIQTMDYELNHRFFGWRPNDIVEWTDNVNNYQLGVLEVTRRTSRILAERISRTGSSASFDPNLETSMNWFMIKADRYWFPSAESKYQEGLDELREYYDKLERGQAQFYTRTDNLIPLLSAYQDLLGSCDENLVKQYEADGSPVSFFKADDYFFYTKGVASALYTILQAIEVDFNIMVSREGGLEVLHHALEMCHKAVEIDPWIVLNGDYSSIFANHRSNMAAPISHARFYIGVLITALST
jgi:hypothetical protein